MKILEFDENVCASNLAGFKTSLLSFVSNYPFLGFTSNVTKPSKVDPHLASVEFIFIFYIGIFVYARLYLPSSSGIETQNINFVIHVFIMI
jgi:hypothetical protein